EAGYTLDVTATENYGKAVQIRAQHVVLKGEGGKLIIRNNGYNYEEGIRGEPQGAGSLQIYDNLTVQGVTTGSKGSFEGIVTSDASGTYVLRNNIVYGFTGWYTNYGIKVTGTAHVYNNTLVGNRIGLRLATWEATVYNNLSTGN